MEEIIFWMEEAADSGVKKIADKVAGDVELVTDRRPRVLYGTSQEELADVAERAETVIVPATVGKSRLLEQMEEEKRIGLEQIRGKREWNDLRTVSSVRTSGRISVCRLVWYQAASP